jgi:hypothetical protein
MSGLSDDLIRDFGARLDWEDGKGSVGRGRHG